jgi:hypothetical protein
MPSQQYDINNPYDENDFIPVINPPASFFKLRAINSNNNPFLFNNVQLSAPSYDRSDTLDQNIDVISAPYQEPDLNILGKLKIIIS